MSNEPKPLSDKQAAFVREYLLDLNATQAAIRAGYSAKSAHVQGPRLLENAEVKEFLDKALAERAAKTEIDAEWLLKRLADEATADLADLYDENNRLKPVSEWPPIWRQGLVVGVEAEELFEGRGEDREHVGTVRKVRLSDRVKRLELIGRHIGVQAFLDKVKVEGLDGLADRLARAEAKDAGSGGSDQ